MSALRAQMILSLLAAGFVCLGLFCPFPLQAAEKHKGIAVNNFYHGYAFPKVTGNIVKAVRYTDVSGDNLVLLTETDVYYTPKDSPDPEYQNKELFAYRFTVQEDGSTEQAWKVMDYVRDCEVFTGLQAEFDLDAFRITDLDNNGEAEIWITYYLACRGDVSPAAMKVIMRQGRQKYAARGEQLLRLGEGQYFGGAYTLDQAFAEGPAEFRSFVAQLWER